MIDYGFETLSLAKVFATTEVGNVASVRVMEKLGMTREALLRSARLARDGTRADELRYAVLAGDWVKRRDGSA